MEYTELNIFMQDIITRINHDKKRLSVIVDTINAGNQKTSMNDRLIGNLSKTEFDDHKLDGAMEYIAIIFANIESQRLSNDKEIIDELVAILSHNLDTVRTIEICIATVKKKFDDQTELINAYKPPDVKNTVINNDNKKSVTRKVTDLSWLKPTNNMANTILYIIFMFIILFGMYEYDRTSLSAISNTTTPITNRVSYKKK